MFYSYFRLHLRTRGHFEITRLRTDDDDDNMMKILKLPG